MHAKSKFLPSLCKLEHLNRHNDFRRESLRSGIGIRGFKVYSEHVTCSRDGGRKDSEVANGQPVARILNPSPPPRPSPVCWMTFFHQPFLHRFVPLLRKCCWQVNHLSALVFTPHLQ